MYVLVNNSLSTISKGIQAVHAVVEYGQKYSTLDEYKNWAKKDKTVIILDGGISNKNKKVGMKEIVLKLKNLKVNFSEFREPDINNCLTAIAFIVDERVYDENKYLSFMVEKKYKQSADKIFELRQLIKSLKLSL